jgi:hypothetical protein
MNFLLGNKYGLPSQNVVKKMFCGEKVTKLPDLTVVSIDFQHLGLKSYHNEGGGILGTEI